MKREKVFLSTVASDVSETSRKYGLGIEIAQFCTAWNMDRDFDKIDPEVKEIISGNDRLILHAPYNEISPAAIDPLVLEITEKRYAQALELAVSYGCKKMVVHSGYTNQMYYECWFEDRAKIFWKNFINRVPEDFTIVFENVLEYQPKMLFNIVKEVDDPRFKLCLDFGHANACIGYGKHIKFNQIGESTEVCDSVYEWLEICAPYIDHYHIHNNTGLRDMHNPVYDGTIDMTKLFYMIDRLTPEATCSLEVSDAEDSILWLLEKGLIK